MKKYLKLKVFNLYAGAALTKDDDDDDESPFKCPVCFNQYNDNEYKPITLLCGHSLCIICLTQLKTMRATAKCPICRMIIADRNLESPKPSFSLMDGSLYLKQIVTNLEMKNKMLMYNLERELRDERLNHNLTKERASVNTKYYDKKVAAISAEEKPKLRYPEAETLKFKEEKKDMNTPYIDLEYIKNRRFNDTLAIKKFVNDYGLEEFEVGEYADKVTFDENGMEIREHILIEHINFHGGVDIKTGLPLYGIVSKTPDGTYNSYTGSSNFIQLRIRDDNGELRLIAAKSGAARIDPEVYKFIQKISPIESARRAQAHKYANEKKTELDSDEEDDY